MKVSKVETRFSDGVTTLRLEVASTLADQAQLHAALEAFVATLEEGALPPEAGWEKDLEPWEPPSAEALALQQRVRERDASRVDGDGAPASWGLTGRIAHLRPPAKSPAERLAASLVSGRYDDDEEG